MSNGKLRRINGICSGCLLIFIIAIMISGGCGKDKSAGPDYNPQIDPINFVQGIDNPYMPLTPGTTFLFQGDTPDGPERNEVYVDHQTRQIMGVTCTIVQDRSWVNDTIAEETYDWYAQDHNGNVWYFGELAIQYENGTPISNEGSWEAGVDDARPGIVMEAHPQIGDSYRQEYLVDVAEDMAQVLSLDDSTTIPFGHFDNCLKTKEWTPLNTGVVEEKLYASGIGNISAVMVEGGTENSELVSVTIDTTTSGR